MEQPTFSEIQATRLGVLSAVLESDVGLALRLLRDVMDQGLGFEAVLSEVLIPIQADIGHRWSLGDYRISEEHAVTAAMETLVAGLGGSIEGDPDAPRVVVVCAEGDTHSLPARMVAVFLSLRGWRVQFLGTGIPADDLGEHLADGEFHALVLACAMRAHLRGARACIEASHRAGVPVIVGGRAFGADDSIAVSLGADGWSNNFNDIDVVLRTWHPDPEKSEATVRQPEPELAMLTNRHRTIVESALGSLPEGITHEELDLLLDNLASSVLVGNADPLIQHATWRDALWTTTVPTASLLEAVAEAIEPTAEQIQQHLAAAISP